MARTRIKKTKKTEVARRAGESSIVDGPSWRDGYRRGAASAADVADGFNASTTHAHRLGDSILAKLNLRPGKPRPNASRIEDPRAAWIRGFAAGLTEMNGRLLDGADPTGVRESARAAGLTMEDFARAETSVHDLKMLRRAGVPERGAAASRPSRRTRVGAR
jgi:hypothetical protein